MHIRVSDLTATSYCERKMVFDRRYGRSGEPEFVAKRAEEGIKAHKHFEKDTQKKQGFLAWLLGLIWKLVRKAFGR